MKYHAIAAGVILSGIGYLISVPEAESMVPAPVIEVSTPVIEYVFVSPVTEPTYMTDEEKIAVVESDPELTCMARNIYFEARSEITAGQFAVADVVLNRVESNRFPDTICEVVEQAQRDSRGNLILNKCQFSWFCDGKSDKITEVAAYKQAQLVTYAIMDNGRYRGITEGADHYHVSDMSNKPYWITSFDEIGDVGEHTFYASN